MQNAESLPQVDLQAGLDVKLGSHPGHPNTLEMPAWVEFFDAERSGLITDVLGIRDDGHLRLWAQADCGRFTDILINLPVYVATSITSFESMLTMAHQWNRVNMNLAPGKARKFGITPADLEPWATRSAAVDATPIS